MLREVKSNLSHVGATNMVISKLHYVLPYTDTVFLVMYFTAFQFPYSSSLGDSAYNTSSNETPLFLHRSGLTDKMIK